MGQTAQQFQLWPAALKSPAPQPGMVRSQQRHAPVTDTIQHQQRRVQAGHHHLPPRLLQLDQTQPAAPARRRREGLQTTGHRVAIAQIADLRRKGLFDHARGGLRRQDVPQGRPRQTVDTGEIRARRDQDSAAAFDIIANRFKVLPRQNTTQFITIKDDQVEFINLFQEQLLGRKSDQRQFTDRHAVLFVGRAQDGEMYQINAGVRFQQIAPGAGAGVGLSADQKHPKAVAHTADLHNRGIVAIGQLARRHRHGEMDHIVATMAQRDGQTQFFAHRHIMLGRRPPIDADRQSRARAPARPRALINNAQADDLLLAQNGEGRRFFDHQPAIPITDVPRQQQMQRRGHIRHRVNVMHLPIRDQNRPRHPVARQFCQGFGQRCAHKGAAILVAVTQPDQFHFQPVDTGHAGLQGRQGIS